MTSISSFFRAYSLIFLSLTITISSVDGFTPKYSNLHDRHGVRISGLFKDQAEDRSPILPQMRPKTKSETPPSPANLKNSTKFKETGIGGNGGVVYDVNQLKRNLLQETISNYKEELWTQMYNPFSTQDEIVERLAALVQASPVRTTTDSNLLEGSWYLVYRSNQECTAENLLELSGRGINSLSERFPGEPERPRTGTKRINISSLHTSIRTYHLEDLQFDEDSHVEDKTQLFGGLFQKSKDYRIVGLTRSTLTLDQSNSELRLAGGTVLRRRSAEDSLPFDSNMVYLDNDLCILAEEGPSNPFKVYMRSETWLRNGHRAKRQWHQLKGRIQDTVVPIFSTPFRMFRKLATSGGRSKRDLNGKGGILREVNSDSAKLRVLRLGDLDEDDRSWEGEKDPFVNMSADERQRMIKAMSIQQVAKFQDFYRSKTRFGRIFGRLFGRKTYFKKVDRKSKQ